MEEQNIQQLRMQTSQYAIEHITGKGLHTHIAWLRDSFNELCEVMNANEWMSDNIGFDLSDLSDNLKKEPWVAEIAAKPAHQRTFADIDRIVNNFVCEYWMTKPEEVTLKDVADILRVANPLSLRHLVAQKVAIDSIHALNKEQLNKLDEVLDYIVKNPKIGNNLHR